MTGAPPKDRPYLPGMGRDALLPLYDPLVRLLGKARIDRQLVGQAAIAPGHRVLEIGCGTGTVTLLAARLAPGARVTGLDPDPRALDRGRRKAARAGLEVRWDRGFAQELPYPDGAFDRVLSSMMLHHLAPDDRAAALAEARRVLAAGGSLHVVDFSDSHHAGLGHRLTRPARHHHRPAAPGGGDVAAELRAAGFTTAAETGHQERHLIGALSFYRADA